MQIARHSPVLTQQLIRACTANQTFKGKIKTQGNDLDPITYLYQLGVLSLSHLGIDYSPGKEVDLAVPNISVRHDYAEAFLDYHTNSTGGTMSAFVNNPTADTLFDCCKQMIQNVKSGFWTNSRTETDIACFLAADLYVNSEADVGMEHHPGEDTKLKIDIKALTDENFVTMEAKFIKARAKNLDLSQSLRTVEVCVMWKLVSECV